MADNILDSDIHSPPDGSPGNPYWIPTPDSQSVTGDEMPVGQIWKKVSGSKNPVFGIYQGIKYEFTQDGESKPQEPVAGWANEAEKKNAIRLGKEMKKHYPLGFVPKTT